MKARHFMNKWKYANATDIDGDDPNFYEIVQNNIKKDTVSLWIAGSAGNHMVVCDGYNSSTDKYHLNCGWEGLNDGWYSLPSGMPTGYNVIYDAEVDITPPSLVSIYVPSSKYPTIQAALDSALGGDTIVVANGRYTGNGNRDLSFHGKEI